MDANDRVILPFTRAKGAIRNLTEQYALLESEVANQMERMREETTEAARIARWALEQVILGDCSHEIQAEARSYQKSLNKLNL